MGSYQQINGVDTWVDERGGGEATVLLLHGGLSNSDVLLDVMGSPLAEHFRVVAFDRWGHGRTGDTDTPFHYDDMATQTIEVLDKVVGGPAHLVGWSDGGIIGLLVAQRRPDLVTTLVAIGTNYHHDGMLPLPEMEADSPVVAMMMDAYGERSPDGVEHFGAVVAKSLEMFHTEPTMTTADLRRIDAPVLVIVGDDDAIKLEHTASLLEALPAGQLAVVPGASHALPMEKPADTVRLVLEFLAAPGMPQTFMPMRRGAGSPP